MTLKNKKSLRAFSLIEVSFVVIIVGILIAGVVTGNNLLIKSKLASARAITQSSPVSGIGGIALWLETSMSDSFLSTQAVDGAQVTVWNDRSPEASPKLYAYKVATASVKYVEQSPINDLPSIYFDGGSDSTLANNIFRISTTSTSLTKRQIWTKNNAFTYFLVKKSDKITDSVNAYAIVIGYSQANGWSYLQATTGARGVRIGGTSFTSLTGITTNPEIISASHPGIAGTVKFNANGVNLRSASSSAVVDPNLNRGFQIGGRDTSTTYDSFWKGYISEIIVFNRQLPDEDVKVVETYLSKKYNIAISN